MIQNSKNDKSDKSVSRIRSSCNINRSEERSMTQGQSKERSRMRGSNKERRRMRGRSKERSRTRRHSKKRSRTRERSEERSRMRGHSKERNKTSGRSKERSRMRKRSKERRRTRGRSKERSKTRGHSKERSKTQGHSKERSKTQGRSKDRSRMRRHSKERSRTEDPFRLVLSPELRQEYEIECLKHYDESKQSSKILESDTECHVIASSSSSIKSSNKPAMIISSDDGSGEEEFQPKKNNKKKFKISKNSDDEDDKEELQPKKNSKKKSKIFRNSDNRNNNEELQLKKDGKKKSKPKSKNSDDENDEEELQPKKDDALRKVTYYHLVDLPKDIKENLRRKVKWNTKRIPLNSQLNINITFKLQKDLVTKMIIPVLFKVLDTKAYPISENMLYEIIHQRHRHQREDLLNKNKAEYEQTKEIRRKHANSRRSELKKSEINPIVMENVYYSPKESEVDPNGDSNETCIIIQDIEWRSDCVNKRRQKRVFDNSRYASDEDTAPLNAPHLDTTDQYYRFRKKSRSTEEAEDAE
ncbi:zinc finger protein 318 isoform X1 [Rhizophagus clarus]|uniref:Zinc finger protein 318 isoform X1 n=1 Tax=Rhizophagus clarus TaxID=94130 RepID=A0A8H3QWQ7_9GLOM|nr:zinc finger protein 318 isoform X1 [Rhizophagus clarus]